MGRRYTVSFEGVPVSLAQDLVTLYPNSGSFPKATVKLLRAWVFCVDTVLPQAQQLKLRVRRLGSITVGSGGSSFTPNPDDPGDATSQYLSRVNDTSVATGTQEWIYDLGCYLYTGSDTVFSDPPVGNGDDGFVFELLSNPSTPLTLSGGLLYEEIGSGV